MKTKCPLCCTGKLKTKQTNFCPNFRKNGYASNPDFSKIRKTQIVENTCKTRSFVFFGRFLSLSSRNSVHLAVTEDESKKV